MKLVYAGDPHERPVAPKNRLDDFNQTYKNKVNEIKQTAIDVKAKALLQPGDFLDAPKYDNAFLMEVIERWSMVPTYELLADLRTGKANSTHVANELAKGIPFVGTIGNHELFGDAIQSYPRTSLAFLEQMGFMILPTKEKPFILTDDDGTTVAITCSPYHGKMDTDAYLSDYIIEKKAADFHIHMVHGYLTNRDMGEMFKHTTLDKIAHETKADLTIAGHDHIGFPLTEVDGKLFVNPGSLSRTKNDLKEMSRQPKLLVIEITQKDGVTVEERPLKSAQPGSIVLSREAIHEKEAKSQQMEEIKSIVNQAQVKQGTSISSIIKNIGKTKGVDKPIVDDVLDRVTIKMEDMNPNNGQAVDPYTIKTLTLENFQGHAHSVLNLSDGLNVIVGESSHGKSAIYRALNWLYDNAGSNPRSFIKKGATYAKVTVALSNGVRISRVVDGKKSGRNGYDIYDPLTKEVTETNTRGAEDVRARLGFHKIPIDGGKELDLNFMGQGESWFFIGKHVTSSERAKIIGSIFGTHYTDAVLKDMEGDVKKTETKLKDTKRQWTEVVDELDTYGFLDAVEKRLKDVATLQEALTELTQRKEAITHLIEKRERLAQQVTHWQTALDTVKDMPTVRLAFSGLKQDMREHRLIVRTHQQIGRIKQEQTAWKKHENSVKDVAVARQIFAETAECVAVKKDFTEQLKRLREAENRLERIVTAHTSTTKQLASTKQISVARKAMHELSEHSQRLIQLASHNQKLTGLTERLAKGQDFLAQTEHDLDLTLDEYEDILTHMGTCPTCHGSIDTAVVKQVVASHRVNERNQVPVA